ncbi:AraC family transcriptional regulator [Thalassotalea psychrophila]|uniref:AraC family transcriptional regulator n=1 Tax=Thalassotalea psychrophila TaxID=3065647 RepID=A0ABY9U030_9GAMM|nr:AraC family transcriptional regulator [Colwelliaceae bacterium SQ149]
MLNQAVVNTSAILQKIIAAKPLWCHDIEYSDSNRVSRFRIERYICNIKAKCLPPINCPILIIHFGGKKVTSLDTTENLTSFPSAATLIPTGIETNWQIEGALDFALVYLTDDVLQLLQNSLAGVTEPLSLNSSLYGALVKELLTKLSEDIATDMEHIAALSRALISLLRVELTASTQSMSFNSARGQFNYVQQAIKFIQANLDKQLKSADVAAHVGLHQSHFRQIFRDVTQTTLHSYVLQLRLEHARDLLLNTAVSIVEIAENSGFSSQSHMTSSFRRYYDMSPASIRKRKP